MPFVKAKHQGGKQKPTTIILRPSFTNSADGAALAIAQRWHQASSFWSAGHYVVDDTRRYRCVPDDVIAGYGDDVDKNAIRIAICADPISSGTFWDENHHRFVLRKTAELVAELSLVYKIRVHCLTDSEFAHWERYRTRRRGGIYIVESRGFPTQAFVAEVDAKRSLKTQF